jgi:hypothetical protein
MSAINRQCDSCRSCDLHVPSRYLRSPCRRLGRIGR